MHKVLSKGALNLKVYKTASCAETHRWINMTCNKAVISGPNLKKLAPKKSNWRKWWLKKKNPSVNPVNNIAQLKFELKKKILKIHINACFSIVFRQ